jgi:hypothetical protein
MKFERGVCAILGCLSFMISAGPASAQVTTGSLTGVVQDSQGTVAPGVAVVAIHVPSGTTYESATKGDGRFFIPDLRVGGPYKVTATLQGFGAETQNDVMISLGVAADLVFKLKVADVVEDLSVIGHLDPVFSSTHTGAATSVTRDDLATMPTVSGRLNDIIRLSPQYGGAGTFAGQDYRSNNITVDGSYFNNSFGLGGQPGDRTGVAPISLEAIEQVQVSVAPFDVRQGNFVGAGVNSVTRSGSNVFSGSLYTRYRNQSFVGTDAAGQAFAPGTFKTTDTGEWLGGPIVKNRLFFFESFEKQNDTRPLSTFTSNPGGVPAGGNTTLVLASDLNALSSFLQQNFNYSTGAFDSIPKLTPAKPWMVKTNLNINSANKLSLRYNQLDSSTDVYQSSSSSLGINRQTNSTNFLTFSNSNYSILENIRSGIGELDSVFHGMTNTLIGGYTHQDESRKQISLFPFVEIDNGSGAGYTSFGSEPFTPFNLLSYNTFQAQDNVTKFSNNHSWTFGGSIEKYHSANSFYPGVQSVYVYNTLADFYTDANGYLTNPNRTTSPVTLKRFQVRSSLAPGQTVPPIQPLDVLYSSAYVQDEWRPSGNLTVTGGVRVDVPSFANTTFDNPNADALTFRDETGAAVQYNSGALPKTTAMWSPRAGFNWSLGPSDSTQIRGGTGVFTGKPPYVWISNQIGNTGALSALQQVDNTTAYPFNPNPDTYKQPATGALASSYELDVTDPNFKFPQTWRTNVGVDRKLPWGLVATGEFIYNRDLNDPYYINANLPAAESAYTGIDNRPRWVATTAFPTCAANGQAGPCVTRLNNAIGNQVTANYVIKNTDQNRSWNYAATVSKAMSHGLSLRGGFTYGVSKSVVEPGSTASSSWGSGNPVPGDPNNAPLAYSSNSPGKRVFLQATYVAHVLPFGATTISMFYDGHTNGNTSYVFSGDANGDTVSGNDLIYIPRNTAEMNFATFTSGGKTFTAADQAAAFEQYIEADSYLSAHRGEYAQRGAVFLPVVNRVDLSLAQDLSHSLGGVKHSAQIRLDITNFGNLLNHNWGVGQRLVNTQILTSPAPDATGALSYRMQLFNGNLLTSPLQTSAGISDVYVMMLSFRYGFN